VVSHSAVFRAQEKRNVKAVKKKQAESAEKTTLGDISDLADLKKKMESGK
jgi:small subunit ribosomal protein S1